MTRENPASENGSIETSTGSAASLLVPGRTCWRVARARRVAFLIDTAAYFEAFSEALSRARRSVFILGWDIHRRTLLRRRGPSGGEEAFELRNFLKVALERNPELTVNVLSWDFAMIYALERESLPIFSRRWMAHPRVHFELDGCHPIGASHHQKVVVVDDALAFAGGVDLTIDRWDTPEHRSDDPRRTDPEGRPYPPFHDVQIAVDGPAAAALGELARHRWRRATGQQLAPPSTETARNDPWPPELEPDVRHAWVGISRTLPAYDDQREAREVESLYLEAIAAAKRFIYIENQYFTCPSICEALAARLGEPSGPEVVLVLPRECPGWLEEATMGTLRARALRKLIQADRCGRFRAYYPVVPERQSVFVHSKVLILDDRLVRIGSSNLSNRSMGLDTECDLVVDATGERRIMDAIAAFQGRLLAEHLGTTAAQFLVRLRDERSLVSTVEGLRGGARTLERLEVGEHDGTELLIPEPGWLDPERPLQAEKLIDRFVQEDLRRSAANPWILGLVLVALLVAAGAAWRWSPLAEWLDLEALSAWGARLRETPWTPLVVIGAYVGGSLVLVPILLLIAATALTFEPWEAMFYCLLGGEAAAMVTYGLGQWLGRRRVRELAGERLNRVSRLLGRRGILASATARVLPLAPFTVINLVAGASHIRFWDFSIGSLIGLAPGVVAITLFKTRLEDAIREPGLRNFALLALVLLALLIAMGWARRRLGEQEDEATAPARPAR